MKDVCPPEGCWHIVGGLSGMLTKSFCVTCVGIDAVTVIVETFLSPGIGIHLVGLPDSAVKESLLRVFTALSSYGFIVPGRKIVVNLAPADLRKEGSSYDLAIALNLIAVSGKIELPRLAEYIIMGELALDGTLRPIPGALPAAIHAKNEGFRGCILPRESSLQAADIEGIEIYGVNRLAEAIEIVTATEGQPHPELLVQRRPPNAVTRIQVNDFKNVKGQLLARRGLEIAASGGHNLILTGSPGSGKTMMASCLPSILPPMTREESIETSKIYSIAGVGWGDEGLMSVRPFRAPHHSASLVSIIGGGKNASPGEISLSHNGVLYLDEVVQFPRTVLDALRQPVEDGKVTISRAKYKVEYPSRFMLIASMNPCPCGYYGDGNGRCRCSRTAIDKYVSRISGPIADRFDMSIHCSRVSGDDLFDTGPVESSAAIAARVAEARRIQAERFAGENIFTNAQMTAEHLRRYCDIGETERKFLKGVVEKLELSARAYGRILKLARTIADLEGNKLISLYNISEAVQFRCLDRNTTND